MNIISMTCPSLFLTVAFSNKDCGIHSSNFILCTESKFIDDSLKCKFVKRKAIDWHGRLDGEYEHLYMSLEKYNYIDEINKLLDNDAIFILEHDYESIAMCEYMYNQIEKLKHKPRTIIVLRPVIRKIPALLEKRKILINTMLPKIFDNVIDVEKCIENRYANSRQQFIEVDMPIILNYLNKFKTA